MEGSLTSATPKYLDEVEQLIGLPFFSDPQQAELARTNPVELPDDEVQNRVALYIGGLRLLVYAKRLLETTAGEQQKTDFTPELLSQVAANQRSAVLTIRGGLMLQDTGLQSPEVTLLLSDMQVPTPVRSKSTPKDKDQEEKSPARRTAPLPAHLMPAQAIESIVDIQRGSVLHAANHRGIEAVKCNLPGPQPSENCYDWSFLADLVAKRGYKASVDTIDFDRLPTSAEDTDPERTAYAREVQLRHVQILKLAGIPVLADKVHQYVADLPTAGPQHISRTSIEKIAGAGFAFVTAYCSENNLPISAMKWRDSNRESFFLQLEDAAQVWSAYKAVPPATQKHMTLIGIARATGHTRYVIEQKMFDEERQTIQSLRALHPAGRVLRHVPEAIGRKLIERLTTREIPPHLISIIGLDKRLSLSYSGIMQKIKKLEVPKERKVVHGSNKPIALIPWSGLRVLDEHCLMPGAETIDYERLPATETDSDPHKIAYARFVQNLYRPERMKPRLLRGAEQLPSGSQMTIDQIASFSGASKELIQQVIRERAIDSYHPSEKRVDAHSRTLQTYYSHRGVVEILDYAVGIHIHTIQQRTGFTPNGLEIALARLSVQPDTRFTPTTLSRILHLRPPQDARALSEMTASTRMDANTITAFLRKHHAHYADYLDRDGNKQPYISQQGVQLLQYQQWASRYPRADASWLERNQILALTNAPLETFEAWLTDTLSNMPREPVRLKKSDLPRNVGWLKNNRDEVLQHFHRNLVYPYIKRYSKDS